MFILLKRDISPHPKNHMESSTDLIEYLFTWKRKENLDEEIDVLFGVKVLEDFLLFKKGHIYDMIVINRSTYRAKAFSTINQTLPDFKVCLSSCSL